MAKKGVYSQAEQTFLASYSEIARARAGWVKPLRIPAVTYDSLALWAQCFDYPNPLWRDLEYGRTSRWGSVIAPPFYQEGIVLESWMAPPVPGMGFPGGGMMGEDWYFYKPLRIGDSFHIWRRQPRLTDVTEEGGPRTFVGVQHDVSLYNQRDELCTRTICHMKTQFFDEPTPRAEPPALPAYTPEVLERIQDVYNSEVLRGAETLWWEDVCPGDRLQPTAVGPTTVWDMALVAVARQDQDLVPMNEQLRDPSKFIGMKFHDAKTGIACNFMETHLVMGGAHQGAVERNGICRCVTNWAGDDAFVTRFNWRQTYGSRIGCALISHGVVREKRVENGQHLVDIDGWCEYPDGTVCAYADISVALCARADT